MMGKSIVGPQRTYKVGVRLSEVKLSVMWMMCAVIALHGSADAPSLPFAFVTACDGEDSSLAERLYCVSESNGHSHRYDTFYRGNRMTSPRLSENDTFRQIKSLGRTDVIQLVMLSSTTTVDSRVLPNHSSRIWNLLDIGGRTSTVQRITVYSVVLCCEDGTPHPLA